MPHLQQNVDLTFMYPYLKDYAYDATVGTGHAFYILPKGLDVDVEMIKLYFGAESSLKWERIDGDFCAFIYLQLIKGVNYKIMPPADLPTFQKGIMKESKTTISDEKGHEVFAPRHDISHIDKDKTDTLKELWDKALENYKCSPLSGFANEYPMEQFIQYEPDAFNEAMVNNIPRESEESHNKRIENFKPIINWKSPD